MAITGAESDAAARQVVKINKQAIFNNCAPFTDCISEITNTQRDNGPDLLQ